MSVIKDVDKKVENLLEMLSVDCSEKDFLEAFKQSYPDDYQKCWNKFREEERQNQVKLIRCNIRTNMLPMR